MADEIVMTSNHDDGDITLDQDARDRIMRALLTGLAAFGEVEKLRNACEIRRICGLEVPDDLTPDEVAASADVVINFAEAMQLIH